MSFLIQKQTFRLKWKFLLFWNLRSQYFVCIALYNCICIARVKVQCRMRQRTPVSALRVTFPLHGHCLHQPGSQKKLLPPPPCSTMHYALCSTMRDRCTCGEKPGSVTEGSGWRWYLCKKLDTDPLPDAFISSPHRHKCHMLRWTSGGLLHKGGWQVVCLCKQEQAKPALDNCWHALGWFPEQVNSFWSSQRLTGGAGSYHGNNTWE